MQNSPTKNSNIGQVSLNSPINYPRVEHQFLTRMPDNYVVETDLMKLLNDFSNSRLKKYGTSEIHDKLFKKMDAVRDKQEKIAKIHFEQDARLTDYKSDAEDHKAQTMRDFVELTRQLEELNNSIHELQDFSQV